MRFLILLGGLVAFGSTVGHADVRGCVCDLTRPESAEARQCGLCRAVEKEPGDQAFLFLKDINPAKPNRLLILPRKHLPGPHSLSSMTPEDRNAYWTAAIAKATELWGDAWGIAINGDISRTQCHTHAHIGKLLPDVENSDPAIVENVAALPVPPDNGGMWFHPVNGKLHVHLANISEPVLMR